MKWNIEDCTKKKYVTRPRASNFEQKIVNFNLKNSKFFFSKSNFLHDYYLNLDSSLKKIFVKFYSNRLFSSDLKSHGVNVIHEKCRICLEFGAGTDGLVGDCENLQYVFLMHVIRDVDWSKAARILKKNRFRVGKNCDDVAICYTFSKLLIFFKVLK